MRFGHLRVVMGMGGVGDEGNLQDDYGHVIGVGDELMRMAWSRL